jgi:hypothetical protein
LYFQAPVSNHKFLDMTQSQENPSSGLVVDLGEDANRVKMKTLCRVAGSYSSAAQLIAKQTQRPLSVDSIKAWTCNPATGRARPCPDWAIIALERSFKRLRKR